MGDSRKRNDKGKKNILINFRGGIGDFILLTPILRNIVKEGRRSLFFIGDVSFRNFDSLSNYFSECFYVNYRGNIFNKLFSALKIICKLAFKNISISITPICSSGKLSCLLTFLSGAEIRIGFQHKIGKSIYTHPVEINATQDDRTQNLKILDILGIKGDIIETEFIIPYRSIRRIDNYFQSERINKQAPLIAIAPFVAGTHGQIDKYWPLIKYEKLAKYILRDFEAEIIFLGSKDELNKLTDLMERFHSDRVHLQDESFSIADAGEVLQRCTVLICNDGGLMHLAVALNRPVISIWGPTNPQRWGYLGKDNFIAIRTKSCEPCWDYKKRSSLCRGRECLESLSVDEVYDVFKKFISSINAKQKPGVEGSDK